MYKIHFEVQKREPKRIEFKAPSRKSQKIKGWRHDRWSLALGAKPDSA